MIRFIVLTLVLAFVSFFAKVNKVNFDLELPLGLLVIYGGLALAYMLAARATHGFAALKRRTVPNPTPDNPSRTREERNDEGMQVLTMLWIGYYILGIVFSFLIGEDLAANLKGKQLAFLPGFALSMLFVVLSWNRYISNPNPVSGAIFFDPLEGDHRQSRARALYILLPGLQVILPWMKHMADISTAPQNITGKEEYPTADGDVHVIHWSLDFKFDLKRLDRALELIDLMDESKGIVKKLDELIKNGFVESINGYFAPKIARLSSAQVLAEINRIILDFAKVISDVDNPIPTPFELHYGVEVEKTVVRISRGTDAQKAASKVDLMQRLSVAARQLVADSVAAEDPISYEEALHRMMVAAELIESEVMEGRGDPLAQLMDAIKGRRNANPGGGGRGRGRGARGGT